MRGQPQRAAGRRPRRVERRCAKSRDHRLQTRRRGGRQGGRRPARPTRRRVANPDGSSAASRRLVGQAQRARDLGDRHRGTCSRSRSRSAGRPRRIATPAPAPRTPASRRTRAAPDGGKPPGPEPRQQRGPHHPTPLHLGRDAPVDRGEVLGPPGRGAAAARQRGSDGVEHAHAPQRDGCPGRAAAPGRRSAAAARAAASAGPGRRRAAARAPPSDVAPTCSTGRSGTRPSPSSRTSTTSADSYASGVTSTLPRRRSSGALPPRSSATRATPTTESTGTPRDSSPRTRTGRAVERQGVAGADGPGGQRPGHDGAGAAHVEAPVDPQPHVRVPGPARASPQHVRRAPRAARRDRRRSAR